MLRLLKESESQGGHCGGWSVHNLQPPNYYTVTTHPAHNLSLTWTVTQCCKCLKQTIKTYGVTKQDDALLDWILKMENENCRCDTLEDKKTPLACVRLIIRFRHHCICDTFALIVNM